MRRSLILLFVAITLYLISRVLLATDLPPWIPAAVEAVAVLVAIVAVMMGAVHLWRAYGHLLKALFKEQPAALAQAAPPPPDPAKETMDRVTQLLARIEPNSADAEARLQDVRVATDTLTRQVLKLVERVEGLEHQANYLNQVTDAIRSGQRTEIAYLAGKIGDESLRTLLLSSYLVSREDFKTEVFVLLANEHGSLEECAAGYGRLITALVGQLAQARTRIVGLEQSITMLEASSPLLLIEQGLQQSIEALNLRAEPALRWTAKQTLPAGVQGYLR
ncbi:MAG: hypothetical protein BroJett011_14390 [Chloroflexota bacterium]|nr:MAG: hypothetical protein BroJett011_14390 [Chloroflexota bacterium]